MKIKIKLVEKDSINLTEEKFKEILKQMYNKGWKNRDGGSELIENYTGDLYERNEFFNNLNVRKLCQ